MSEPAVRAELEIRFKDGVTAGLKATEIAAEKTAKKVAETAADAAKKAAGETETATNRQRTSYEKLSRAREALGIRSETAIRREIQHTEAAYKRLEASGQLSGDALARASDKARERVTRLTNEMGKLTAEQKKAAQAAADFEKHQARAEQMQTRMRTGVAVGVGAAAAAYTLKAPAMAAMSLDERIGLLSNTAYAERDAAGRKIGDAQILAAVKGAISTGLTKESAMDALEKLVADNQVGGVAGALELLPYIGKVTTGSGSSSRDVAAMMGGFIGSGYAKSVGEAKRMMGMASAAATAGAFEKNDMARYLPSLLPLAKTVGLTGEDGFRRLMVLLQQSRSTSGSSEEAANNVRNLLSKLQSGDTATDFKKAGRGDLYAYMMNQKAKGVDPLTAWQNVIDQEISKNPNLKPALAKLQNANSKEEQDAAIEAIKGMAEGQSIGKFFQDMQAKGAVLGMRNREIGQKVDDALRMSGSIVETDYQAMASKAGVKMRIAGERVDLAKYDAIGGLTPAISKTAELFGELSAKFPVMTGSMVLATTAVGALAGAAGLASLTLGGGKNGAIAATALKYAPKATNLGRASLYGASAVAGDYALDKAFGESSVISRYGSSALNFAAVGATLGSVVPGLGTGVGAGVGVGAGLLWESLKDVYSALKPIEQKPSESHIKLDVNLPPGATVKSQSMRTSGNITLDIATGSMVSVP